MVKKKVQEEYTHVNSDDNAEEWPVEDQRALERKLNRLVGKGVDARVMTSAGERVKVKFFRDNKIAGSFTTYHFSDKAEQTKLEDVAKSLS